MFWGVDGITLSLIATILTDYLIVLICGWPILPLLKLLKWKFDIDPLWLSIPYGSSKILEMSLLTYIVALFKIIRLCSLSFLFWISISACTPTELTGELCSFIYSIPISLYYSLEISIANSFFIAWFFWI